MSRANSKGRSKNPPFVMFLHGMVDSPAWADLTGTAVKLLVHLTRRYNGANNGDLFLSVRDASTALGVASGTAAAAFRSLEAHGFIAATQRGSFKVKIKLATTWRLTFQPTVNRAPTNDWREWERQSSVSKTDTVGVNIRYPETKTPLSRYQNPTPTQRKTAIPARPVGVSN